MNTIEHSDGVLVKGRRITLSDQDPLTFVPHGDRLLVEVLETDETLRSGIVVVRQDDKGKEHEVGWTAGVIITVGSGHRLDTPDQAVRISTTDTETNTRLIAVDTDTKDGIIMAPSTVPMPFLRGQVVMLAKYSGSDILLKGMRFKVITQAHVLGMFTNMRLDVEGYYASGV